jgi:hypothetical protein
VLIIGDGSSKGEEHRLSSFSHQSRVVKEELLDDGSSINSVEEDIIELVRRRRLKHKTLGVCSVAGRPGYRYVATDVLSMLAWNERCETEPTVGASYSTSPPKFTTSLESKQAFDHLISGNQRK